MKAIDSRSACLRQRVKAALVVCGIASFVLAQPAHVSGASVGGIISANTQWTLANSPYSLTSKVQVAYGATLSIAPGVVVNGYGYDLELFGTMNAEGTAASRVRLNGLNLCGNGIVPNQRFSIVLRFVHWIGGSARTDCGSGSGIVTIEDSILEIGRPSESAWALYLWYPTGDCSIQRNVFYRSGGITVGSGYRTVILNNIFYQPRDYAVKNWTCRGGCEMTVSGNSFIGGASPLLRLEYTYSGMDASGNFWGTTDLGIIDSRIWDMNDDLSTGGFINYQPILTTPAPATPTIALPAITTHPQSQNVVAGQNVSFSVAAEGFGDLTYQWLLNSQPLPGSSNSTLLVSNVGVADAGSYSVRVANFVGQSVTSQVATLIIQAPPTLTSGPENQSVTVGGSAMFSVTATGSSPLMFQWSLNGINLPGATSAALTLTNLGLSQAGTYTVTVTDGNGATSQASAVLTVVTIDVLPVVTVAGRRGSMYRIEYAEAVETNTWSTLALVTIGENPYLFVDTTSPRPSRRFYRAILLP